jgi:uncharacterized protein YwqG
MYWGSGGRLYFTIELADLRALDFSRVEVALQCT